MLPDAEPNADLAYDLDQLREMADIGIDALRILHADIAAKPTPPEHREASASAIERIMRAVRRTIHLRQHLREHAGTAAATRTAARIQVLRKVENRIATRAGEQPEMDTAPLRLELLERLESVEFEHEIRTRPVAEIVTEILEDLGLDHRHYGVTPRPRRTPADLRALAEQAAAPAKSRPKQPAEPAPAPEPVDVETNRSLRPDSFLNQLLRER